MKYTAAKAWEMSLANRHEENIKDWLNEAILQATRSGKARCVVMCSYDEYKHLVNELNEKDYVFSYDNGELTVTWYNGGASKLYKED